MAAPGDALLDVEQVGDETVVRFTSRQLIDLNDCEAIREQLDRLVDGRAGLRLRLDFARVEYVHSAYLGALITLQKKVVGSGGRLVLCNVDAYVLDVFRRTRLDRFFRIEPSVGSD